MYPIPFRTAPSPCLELGMLNNQVTMPFHCSVDSSWGSSGYHMRKCDHHLPTSPPCSRAKSAWLVLLGSDLVAKDDRSVSAEVEAEDLRR